MATINRFEDLEIWQLSRSFCKRVYDLCQIEALSKDFALRNQIRKSSGSVMDNIAEGFERSGTKEFLQFLYIAKASAGEVRSQLYRIEDSHYIESIEADELRQEIEYISIKINNLIKYLRNSDYKGEKYK